MNVGMLWYDNSKDDLAEKIKRAAQHYRDKYGAPADLVFVNPKMLNGPVEATGIEVRTSTTILPNHLWMGRDKH
jgi:hypothetical protein